MAAYDWLPGYEAARYANVFGDQSARVADQFKDLAGADYDKLYGNAITDAGIDWSKLPQMGPQGFNLPANSMWHPVGGRSGYQPISGAPTYEDPNYGTLQLIQQRAPNSLGLDLAKAGALGLASVGIGGGLGIAASELGAGTGLWGAAGDAYLPGLASGPSWGSAAVSGLKGLVNPVLSHWSELFPSSTATSAASAVAPKASANTIPAFPTDFNASLYGNFGSLTAPADGSAMVASSVAPSAYVNSSAQNPYNSVVT